MKKLVFTALAVVAFSGVSFAGTKEIKGEIHPKVEKEKVVTVEEVKSVTLLTEVATKEDDSLTCWVFGKWLRSKLDQISNNDALIDSCVDAAVDLCEIFN